MADLRARAEAADLDVEHILRPFLGSEVYLGRAVTERTMEPSGYPKVPSMVRSLARRSTAPLPSTPTRAPHREPSAPPPPTTPKRPRAPSPSQPRVPKRARPAPAGSPPPPTGSAAYSFVSVAYGFLSPSSLTPLRYLR